MHDQPDAAATRARSLEDDLSRALAAGELLLHYQPIVDMVTGECHGAEALVRWQHPLRGLLYPDEFLVPVRDEAVLHELTRWVLASACRTATAWRGRSVSVNVTASDVARPSFVEDLHRILNGTGLDRERLVVELTETAVIQDLQAAASTLRELRELGVGVALDDFGTGYSSMLYLRDLPVSVLKIDREFVQRVTRSGGDYAIVQSTMSLARSLGLVVIAEGVEGQGQARSLCRLGCRLAQGYLYGRPMPIEQLEVRATAQRGCGPAPDLLPVSEMLAEQQARDLRAGGASLCTIAAALNGAGYRTPVGRLWRPASVAILLRANAKLPA